MWTWAWHRQHNRCGLCVAEYGSLPGPHRAGGQYLALHPQFHCVAVCHIAEIHNQLACFSRRGRGQGVLGANRGCLRARGFNCYGHRSSLFSRM